MTSAKRWRQYFLRRVRCGDTVTHEELRDVFAEYHPCAAPIQRECYCGDSKCTCNPLSRPHQTCGKPGAGWALSIMSGQPVVMCEEHGGSHMDRVRPWLDAEARAYIKLDQMAMKAAIEAYNGTPTKGEN